MDLISPLVISDSPLSFLQRKTRKTRANLSNEASRMENKSRCEKKKKGKIFQKSNIYQSLNP